MWVFRLMFRSIIGGGILFGLFVWAFGLPGEWNYFVTAVFSVAGVIVLGTVAAATLKGLLIMTVIKDLFGDNQ